jgi:hypothetical protein
MPRLAPLAGGSPGRTGDVPGTLPTPEQVTEFVANTAADKRDELIDALLETPEHTYHFANKWADVLRVKRRGEPNRAWGTFAFPGWIRNAIADANLPQALHLLNSDEVQGKVTNGGRVAALTIADNKRPDAERVEELFLWAFGRKPTENDLKVALAHLAKHEKNTRTAYENILWAVLNTKEFQFNQ